MLRQVIGVTLDNVNHLPQPCRSCVFWEIALHAQHQAEEFGQIDVEKEAWISTVLLEWGSCGRLAYIDGVPAGYVMYAPPSFVPRAASFPTAPCGPDAVLFTALRVIPEFTGLGVGRSLAQAAVNDLTRRGVKAIEVFADATPTSISRCVIPAEFLLKIGFKTVRPHSRWPRLRMELPGALSWKKDVEAALAQILSAPILPARI